MRMKGRKVVFFLSLMLFVSLALMLRDVYATAVVWTDKAEYASWETVTIFGSGFNPNVYYDIPVIRPDGSIVRGDGSSTLGWDTVQADLYGKFTYYYQLDGIVGLYEVRVYDSPWPGSLDQTPLATTTFTDATPAANLDQVRNGPATAPVSPGDWVNGNAGPSNAHYIEGYSIPYRCIMTSLPIGPSITLTLGYDIKHGDKHAIDYLTHFDRINVPPHNDVFGHPPEAILPLLGVTGVSATVSTYAIPAPSSTGSPVPPQPTQSHNDLITNEGPDSVKMTLFGGTISGISYFSQGNLTASKSETQISVTFTADSQTAVLAWGGHIASRLDWGYEPGGDPRSAGGISGSPYHMRLIGWTLDTLGQQDRSLKSAAVYAMDGSITVIKDAIPDDSQVFTFTSTTLSSPFYLDDDGVGDNFTIFSGLGAGTYDVTETVPTGWDLTSIVISDPSGGSSSSGSTATIDLAEGESVVVLFTDTKRGKIIVDKVTDPSGSSQSFDFLVTGPSYSDSFSLTDAAAPHDSGWIKPGTYAASETVPAGWVLTSAVCSDGSLINNIILDPGETVIVTFTDARVPPEKASLGNFVWEDLNGNGVQDPSEPGVFGVTVSLYRSDGTFVGSTTTDGSGYYSFTDLDPGDYYLVFTLPSGYVFTLQDEGADDAFDSDVDPSTGRTMVINLQAGENDPSWDVGLIKAPVGGVWVPINKFELLAPYLGLVSVIVSAVAVSGVIVKRMTKKKQP